MAHSLGLLHPSPLLPNQVPHVVSLIFFLINEFLLGPPKIGFTPGVNLWKRNHRTNTCDLQQKNMKKIQGLCLFSFSPRDVLFLFVQLTQSTQLSYTFSFSWQLLKKCSSEYTFVLVNKDRVCVLINFPHCEVTTGSDNYFRRSDTDFNGFEHGCINTNA